MAYQPFRHLGLKFVSIALAFLLWLTVGREPIVQRTVRVPLQFQDIPDGLLLIGDPPGFIDVSVRGAANTVGGLDAGEMQAVIKLETARPGTRLYHLSPDQIRAPYDVVVEQVAPGTIGLHFERSHSRNVPVVPAIEGEPRPGFLVGTISSDPATVTVIGPESDVKRVTEATTEPISIAGRESTVREEVTVGVAEGDIRLNEATRARVTVTVVPAPIERQVNDVPVRLRHSAPDHSAYVQPSLVQVKVRGTADEIAQLRSERIQAFVDVAGLGRGRYDLPVQVDPLERVGVIAVEPRMVQVQIK